MKVELPIALVAAVASNGVIGRDGDMPWKLSSDLKRFKRDTMGKPIIMGRKTFESIGKPLPVRLNIVVSRSEISPSGLVYANSIDAALFIAHGWASENNANEICVIGGGQIYASTFELATRLYIPEVLAEPDGDTFFPSIDEEQWRIASSLDVPAGEKDSAATRYIVYERIKSTD